jgi:hypothetical protein
MGSSSSPPQLTACYQSSDASHNFTEGLPAISGAERKAADGGSVEEKTAYLSALRTGVVQLQADVNAFLTKKMEEDQKAAGDNAPGKSAAVDQKEEDMYGEEDPEDDD